MQTNVCYISGSAGQSVGRLPTQQAVRTRCRKSTAGQSVGSLPTHVGSLFTQRGKV